MSQIIPDDHEYARQFRIARALELAITDLRRPMRRNAERMQAAEVLIGLRDLLCGAVTLPPGSHVAVTSQSTLLALLREREDLLRQHDADMAVLHAHGLTEP